MNKLTLAEMLKIIVGECRNSCHNEENTFKYFERNYRDRTDFELLRALLPTLNFSGIREVDARLYHLL